MSSSTTSSGVTTSSETFVKVKQTGTIAGSTHFEADIVSCEDAIRRETNKKIFDEGVKKVVDYLNALSPTGKNLKSNDELTVYLKSLNTDIHYVLCFLHRFLRIDFKTFENVDKKVNVDTFEKLCNHYGNNFESITIFELKNVNDRFNKSYKNDVQDDMLYFAYVFLIFLTAPEKTARQTLPSGTDANVIGENTDFFVESLKEYESTPGKFTGSYITNKNPDSQKKMSDFILDNIQLFRVIAEKLNDSKTTSLKNFYYLINKISNIAIEGNKAIAKAKITKGGSSKQSKTKQKRHNHYKNGSTRRNKSQNIDY